MVVGRKVVDGALSYDDVFFVYFFIVPVSSGVPGSFLLMLVQLVGIFIELGVLGVVAGTSAPWAYALML